MRMGVFEDISSGHVLMYYRNRRLCFILWSGMACVGRGQAERDATFSLHSIPTTTINSC